MGRRATVSPRVVRAATEELARRSCLESFGSFFHATLPSPDYVYGRHTTKLIHELDDTVKMLKRGQCRYLIVCEPPRHGKSDIVSRRFGPWALLDDPSREIILASYNYELATDMSYECRRLFRHIAPLYNMDVERSRSSVDNWKIAGHNGSMFSAGIGGTITGRGAHILLVDDYCKNRMEAESLVHRDRIWTSMQSDLLTRLAPVHAVVIVANRWHEDDLIGRILCRNDPTHPKYDPDFPVFELIRFPAWTEEYGWLFPERFSGKWYKAQRAMMGSYAWSAQGLQDPQPRTGNLLRADMVNTISESAVPTGLRWKRGWDLASSEKQRIKDDPDFTVGTLAAYHAPSDSIYVRDVVRGQWAAPARDKQIIRASKRDGRGVTVTIEVVGGYKDTYSYMRNLLSGHAVLRKVTPTKDKVARASILESIFEGGRVNIVRGNWNTLWLKEMATFPGSSHDDQVDSLTIAIGRDCANKQHTPLQRL